MLPCDNDVSGLPYHLTEQDIFQGDRKIPKKNCLVTFEAFVILTTTGATGQKSVQVMEDRAIISDWSFE